MKVSHRITRLTTAALIAGTLAAPAASARPVSDPPIYNDRGSVAMDRDSAPVAQSVDEGFDWASAAIGAGAAGGLILLLGAGGTTYRHRQEHVGVAH